MSEAEQKPPPLASWSSNHAAGDISLNSDPSEPQRAPATAVVAASAPAGGAEAARSPRSASASGPTFVSVSLLGAPASTSAAAAAAATPGVVIVGGLGRSQRGAAVASFVTPPTDAAAPSATADGATAAAEGSRPPHTDSDRAMGASLRASGGGGGAATGSLAAAGRRRSRIIRSSANSNANEVGCQDDFDHSLEAALFERERLRVATATAVACQTGNGAVRSSTALVVAAAHAAVGSDDDEERVAHRQRAKILAEQPVVLGRAAALERGERRLLALPLPAATKRKSKNKGDSGGGRRPKDLDRSAAAIAASMTSDAASVYHTRVPISTSALLVRSMLDRDRRQARRRGGGAAATAPPTATTPPPPAPRRLAPMLLGDHHPDVSAIEPVAERARSPVDWVPPPPLPQDASTTPRRGDASLSPSVVAAGAAAATLYTRPRQAAGMSIAELAALEASLRRELKKKGVAAAML